MLRHLTVETGHEHMSPRHEVADSVVDALRPNLQRALETGRRVRAMNSPYWFTAKQCGNQLTAEIGHQDDTANPVVAISVHPSVELEPALLEVRLSPLLSSFLDYPSPASVLDDDMVEHILVIADLERCIAWTWLESIGE